VEDPEPLLGLFAFRDVAQDRLDRDDPAVLDGRFARGLHGERLALFRLVKELDGGGLAHLDGPADHLEDVARVLGGGNVLRNRFADLLGRVVSAELLHRRAAIRQGAAGRQGDDDVALVLGEQAVLGLTLS